MAPSGGAASGHWCPGRPKRATCWRGSDGAAAAPAASRVRRAPRYGPGGAAWPGHALAGGLFRGATADHPGVHRSPPRHVRRCGDRIHPRRMAPPAESALSPDRASFGAAGLRGDAALPRGRLPRGLGHRPKRPPAEPASPAGGAAVLDQPAGAHVRDDLPAPRYRPDQQRPAVARCHSASPHAALHTRGRTGGTGLHLPPVHDPPDLRHAGEARSRAPRSGRSARRPVLGTVPPGDPSPLRSGRRRRVTAGVHSRARRVSHPRSAGRRQGDDDRQFDREPVHHRPRLAVRIGRVLPRHGARAGRRADLSQPP